MRLFFPLLTFLIVPVGIISINHVYSIFLIYIGWVWLQNFDVSKMRSLFSKVGNSPGRSSSETNCIPCDLIARSTTGIDQALRVDPAVKPQGIRFFKFIPTGAITRIEIKLLLLFLAYLLISCLWAYDPSLSFNYAWKTAYPLFLFGVALFFPISQNINKTYNALHAGIWVSLIVFMIEITFHQPISSFLHPKQLEMIQNKIFYNGSSSIYIILLWPCIGWLVLQKKWAETAILILLTEIVFFNLDSDRGKLCALLGPFIFLGSYFGKRLFTLLAYPLIGFFLLVVPFLTPILNSIEELDIIKDPSYLHRIEIYTSIADKIKQHPFWGYGINAIHAPDFFALDTLHFPKASHAHNWFLQWWLDLGLFGVLMMLGFLYFIMRALSKLQGLQFAALNTSFCLGLIMVLVDNNAWKKWWLAFIIFLFHFAKHVTSDPVGQRQ